MARYDFRVSTGVVLPDTADIIAEVGSEWRAAFGDDLNVAPETPQGVMISAEVAARSDFLKNCAALANQINPNLAGGLFLEAICALLGLERAALTPTRVSGVLVTGVPGTIITAGVRARTGAGDLFATAATVTLDGSGEAVAEFYSVEGGPVPCAALALANIVDPVLGWETVSNPVAGVLGTLKQSDEAFRALRRVTLAKQGISVPEAIISDLYAIDTVRSLIFRENTGSTPLSLFPGFGLAPHSIWVCVAGGTDEAIAEALLRNKTAGAGWNNGSGGVPVSIDVVEPASGQTYPVLFDRANDVPILVRVTVRRGLYTADITPTVRAAVVAYGNGELAGEQGFTVGGRVSPFELSGAIGVGAPGLFVVKVEVAFASSAVYTTDELVMTLYEIATVVESSVTVIEV